MRNTGLFGGTFDPVHIGHIELALYALKQCNLEKVIFIPAASPPHKTKRQLTAFHHRVAMLSLAIGDDKRFVISEIEKSIPPPSYTVDTLSYMLREKKEDTEYSFIIGIDAFLDIHTWKEYQKVIGSVHFIVASRPGYSAQDLQDCIASLNYEKKGDHWYNTSTNRNIYYLTLEIPDISSTEIRKKVGATDLPEDAIAPLVYKYIRENNLYAS
jgi:nicotinate-nucleotide adenylyltransferase